VILTFQKQPTSIQAHTYDYPFLADRVYASRMSDSNEG